MRGKRSKQYRKLMNQYELAFNFREPYQVLVDSDIVRDTSRMKMDLSNGLTRTLHGTIKPMITTCSMRHLYASNEQEAIELAKTFERRRCNHHTLDEPLPELDCLKSVVDPKDSGNNKNRYVVASQLSQVRSHMRGILGVPLVYVKKSVMIMEPMAEKTTDERLKEERSKFRLGLKVRTGARSILGKRGREDEDGKENERSGGLVENEGKKSKKGKGPKGANPLSMKKPKKRDVPSAQAQTEDAREPESTESQQQAQTQTEETQAQSEKRKRRRKSSKRTDEPEAIEVADD
jgi:U3 small nucleolar RNA-associated protein 23